MIKVDKNVPMPEPMVPGRPLKYPWDSMGIGDSFFVPNVTLGTFSAPYARAVSHKERYTVRTVTEKGVKGCRVWRIA